MLPMLNMMGMKYNDSSKIPWVQPMLEPTLTRNGPKTGIHLLQRFRPVKVGKINADFAIRNTVVFYQSKELTVL